MSLQLENVLTNYFMVIDAGRNEKIDERELISGQSDEAKEEYKALFAKMAGEKKFHLDLDGFLNYFKSFSEEKRTHEAVSFIVNHVDNDRNGKLSIQQFVQVMDAIHGQLQTKEMVEGHKAKLGINTFSKLSCENVIEQITKNMF